MRGGAVRGALPAVLAGLALALAFASCSDDGGTNVKDERATDVEILHDVLGRQLSAVAAYDRILPALQGPPLAAARKFRAQEQEHVDSVIKALRGLNARAEPATEEIEPNEAKTEADRLRFLYEMESETIDTELDAISKLSESWPRTLLGTTVANQAQHLVLLRRALGATPLGAVPDAFEGGKTPAP
jgi:hypothetical protein